VARGDFTPRALPKLDVTVSRHPAPIVQPNSRELPMGKKSRLPLRYALQPKKSPTLMFSQSFVFPGMPIEQDYCSKVERYGKGRTCGSVRNN